MSNEDNQLLFSYPKILVLTGPTSVGKGTLSGELKRFPELNLWFSVSATTRSPRPGEVDGRDYHFITETEFDQWLAADDFLEWAVVHGTHRYGTPKHPLVEAVKQGRTCLLEIDLQGARHVKPLLGAATFVFVEPPSIEELVARQHKRNTESPEEMARRLETAKVEMAAKSEFDVDIVNDDLERAVAALHQLARSL
jgi:guanylate kinase